MFEAAESGALTNTYFSFATNPSTLLLKADILSDFNTTKEPSEYLGS